MYNKPAWMCKSGPFTARRVFGIPDFRLYALADGIKHVLFNRSKGIGTYPRPPEPVFFQRPLFSS